MNQKIVTISIPFGEGTIPCIFNAPETLQVFFIKTANQLRGLRASECCCAIEHRAARDTQRAMLVVHSYILTLISISHFPCDGRHFLPYQRRYSRKCRNLTQDIAVFLSDFCAVGTSCFKRIAWNVFLDCPIKCDRRKHHGQVPSFRIRMIGLNSSKLPIGILPDYRRCLRAVSCCQILKEPSEKYRFFKFMFSFHRIFSS